MKACDASVSSTSKLLAVLTAVDEVIRYLLSNIRGSGFTVIVHVTVYDVPLLLAALAFIVLVPAIDQEVVKLSKLLFWFISSLNQFHVVTVRSAVALKLMASPLFTVRVKLLLFVLLLLQDVITGASMFNFSSLHAAHAGSGVMYRSTAI
ncbi:Uncharacterised protein [uncultured archaeon]|nr:Uncharacterised protein [uncultured archaeon]